jgi:hypothetical protein
MGAAIPRWNDVVDLRRDLRVPVSLLVAALLWFGFFPQSVVRIITPGLQTYIAANR